MAQDFIGVKSFKAKGKRLTTFSYSEIKELEPIDVPESETPEDEETPDETEETVDDTAPEQTDQEIIDEINGQKRLF